MKDGIYKLIFNTIVNLNGPQNGILTVRDGRITGGDHSCYYKGLVNGNQVAVSSYPHNKNDTSAFNSKCPLELELMLKEYSFVYIFTGALKGEQSQTIHGEFRFLSDLL